MMTDTRNITLPTFDGEDESYQVFWTKFRAFATAKGFVGALMGRETQLPTRESMVLDETKDANKLKIKVKQNNSLAMAYLLSAFKAEADISLAYETMTDEWPGQLAYKSSRSSRRSINQRTV